MIWWGSLVTVFCRTPIPSFCLWSKLWFKQHDLVLLSLPRLLVNLPFTYLESHWAPTGILCSRGTANTLGQQGVVNMQIVRIFSTHAFSIVPQTLLTKHGSKVKLLRISRQWRQSIKPSTRPFWAQGHVWLHKLHPHEASLGRRRWEVTQIPDWEGCCSSSLIKWIIHLQQKNFSSFHFWSIGVFSSNQVLLCEKSTTSWWWCHSFEERIHLPISAESAEALS